MQVGFQRRFDAGYRAARAGVAARRARQAPRTARSRRTTRRRRPRPTSPPRAASSAISTSTTSTPSASSRARRSSRSTQTARCARAPWFARPRRRRRRRRRAPPERRRARDPLGHAPRSARLRRPARGLRHRRQHRRRSRRRGARSARSSPALRRHTVPGYRDFMDRFEPAYRAELAAFVATRPQHGPDACSLREARAALHVALAADRSRAERRPDRDRGDRPRLSHRGLRQPAGNPTKETSMGIEERSARDDRGSGRALAARPDRQGRPARGRPDGIRRAGRGVRGGERGHDDQDRRRDARRHGLVLVGVQERRRPGRQGPQGPWRQRHAGLREQRRVEAGLGHQRRDRGQGQRDRDLGAGRERAQGSALEGGRRPASRSSR